MPVSPADAEDLARAVRRLYEEAEDALLGKLSDALAAGIQAPRWAEDKLRSIGQLRAGVEEIIAVLRQDAAGAIGQAVAQAYERGRQAAVAELGMLPEGLRAAAARDIPNAPAVDRLARAAVAEQEPVWQRILRAVLDIYRTVVGRASATVLTGVNTRRQAAQRALDQFAGRGVTGFVDRAGRSWEMASYAEMAVRTTTARAAVQGHTDRLQAMGQHLVIVSDSPLECERCEPWEGKVLALNGPPGEHTVRVEHATEDGRLVVVRVAGTLPEARAGGLFHPNCRHSVSLFLPGVTTRPSSPPHPGGATYEDTQQQRYLERQVRAWKRREAAAMDDTARRRARASVRAYQGRIRELTADKQLPRKPVREQIGRAR
ncbi:phage minor capsid protein [Kitasatospora sp. NPDC056181]|uniref:phage minor capsid protein n=1 Tax=Kitasatospora sp. NPDC056181 TaxID=3345737 RepID=UPI0035D60938